MGAIRGFGIAFLKPFALPVLWYRRKFREAATSGGGSGMPEAPSGVRSYVSLFKYRTIMEAMKASYDGGGASLTATFFMKNRRR